MREGCAREARSWTGLRGVVSHSVAKKRIALTVDGVLNGIRSDDDAVISLCVTGRNLAIKQNSSGVLCGKRFSIGP
jgi:hypothetical protein